jgi:hypothetical protein
MEDRAHETSNIAQKAVGQLGLAEKRIQELEAEQQAAQTCINDSQTKIRVVGEALRQERLRVEAAENHIHQLEARAAAAEARAKENEGALARVEDAIRTQILGQVGSTSKNSIAAGFNGGTSRVFEGRPVRWVFYETPMEPTPNKAQRIGYKDWIRRTQRQVSVIEFSGGAASRGSDLGFLVRA